jgi:putative transcription antitermination factor YqgF
MNNLPSVLAIDYGTKRIGLARSFGTLAEPWRIVNQADFSNLEAVCLYLSQLIVEEQFTQVVVGISEGEMAVRTKDFIALLQKNIAVPIVTFDETLSSQQVTNKLKNAGKSTSRRKNIDHFAAAEFLQEWLDEQA